jgi:hypothetical protein
MKNVKKKKKYYLWHNSSIDFKEYIMSWATKNRQKRKFIKNLKKKQKLILVKTWAHSNVGQTDADFLYCDLTVFFEGLQQLNSFLLPSLSLLVSKPWKNMPNFA